MRRYQKAFTLIELLLVLAIIGCVVAITLPAMSSSIRGNKMRMAARSIVTAGRYARSMAILRQAEMGLSFNIDAGSLSVHSAAGAPDNPPPPIQPGPEGTPVTSNEENAGTVFASDSAFSGPGELTRSFDPVKIEYIEIGDTGERYTRGRCAISYARNGRCTPYKVKITDEEGKGLLISVDAFSSAKTEEVF